MLPIQERWYAGNQEEKRGGQEALPVGLQILRREAALDKRIGQREREETAEISETPAGSGEPAHLLAVCQFHQEGIIKSVSKFKPDVRQSKQDEGQHHVAGLDEIQPGGAQNA